MKKSYRESCRQRQSPVLGVRTDNFFGISDDDAKLLQVGDSERALASGRLSLARAKLIITVRFDKRLELFQVGLKVGLVVSPTPDGALKDRSRHFGVTGRKHYLVPRMFVKA
jgi:hypothetical protein